MVLQAEGFKPECISIFYIYPTRQLFLNCIIIIVYVTSFSGIQYQHLILWIQWDFILLKLSIMSGYNFKVSLLAQAKILTLLFIFLSKCKIQPRWLKEEHRNIEAQEWYSLVFCKRLYACCVLLSCIKVSWCLTITYKCVLWSIKATRCHQPWKKNYACQRFCSILANLSRNFCYIYC